MPTILRLGAYRFYFFSHEPNEPSHVHMDRDEATMKIWLDTLDIAKSRGFRAHEQRVIVEHVRQHRAMLTERWHEYFGWSDGRACAQCSVRR